MIKNSMERNGGNRKKSIGIVAIEIGYITKDQLDDAIIAQMTDEVLEREHRRIGTILLDLAHITVAQIDEVLGVIKQSLS